MFVSSLRNDVWVEFRQAEGLNLVGMMGNAWTSPVYTNPADGESHMLMARKRKAGVVQPCGIQFELVW